MQAVIPHKPAKARKSSKLVQTELNLNGRIRTDLIYFDYEAGRIGCHSAPLFPGDLAGKFDKFKQFMNPSKFEL